MPAGIHNFWKKDEDSVLEKVYKRMRNDEIDYDLGIIAKILNRTKESIATRIKKIGLREKYPVKSNINIKYLKQILGQEKIKNV